MDTAGAGTWGSRPGSHWSQRKRCNLQARTSWESWKIRCREPGYPPATSGATVTPRKVGGKALQVLVRDEEKRLRYKQIVSLYQEPRAGLEQEELGS